MGYARFPGGQALAWGLAAATLVVDTIWLALTDMDLVWWTAVLPTSVATGLLLLAALYTFKRPELALARMCLAAAFLVVYTLAAATLSYLVTTVALPLQDSTLAAIDNAIGFDWLDFLALSNSHDWLSFCLVAAYHSSMVQIAVLVIYCGLTKRTARIDEFLALFAMTSLSVIVLSMIVPAEGAFALFAPSPDQFDGFSAQAGMWHYQIFTALRDGSMTMIDLRRIEGLITFPSFHTALAIITLYALRRIPWLFPALILLNSLLVVATLPEGGHYLVDIFAGAAIAAAAIAVVRYMQNNENRQSRQQRIVAIASHPKSTPASP